MGPAIWIVRGAGATPPGNVEILHALKCVLGTSEAYSTYIPASYCLRLAVSDREKYDIRGPN